MWTVSCEACAPLRAVSTTYACNTGHLQLTFSDVSASEASKAVVLVVLDGKIQHREQGNIGVRRVTNTSNRLYQQPTVPHLKTTARGRGREEFRGRGRGQQEDEEEDSKRKRKLFCWCSSPTSYSQQCLFVYQHMSTTYILHGVGACLSVCPGPCELMSLRNLVPLRGWGEEVHSPRA